MARTDNLWINRAGNYMETSSPDGYNILINGDDRYINFRLVSGSLGYGFRDNNGTIQVKHSGGAWADIGSGGVLISSVTFSELTTLKGSSGLAVGQQYLISDFKTKHNLYNGTTVTATVIEGSVEPLIVTAVSTSQISLDVKSSLYPNDTITYDSTNVLCEDGTTARPGKITYRKNSKGNETYYDFRGVKFRRWKFDLTGYTDFDFIAYVQGDIVKYNNALYYCVEGKTADDTPDFDTVYWKPIIDGDGYYAWQTASINIAADPVNLTYLTIPVDSTSYYDFYTFSNPTGLEKSDTFYQGFVLGKPDINIPYNNTVFNVVDHNKNNDNFIGTNHFNTILSEFQANTIGNEFAENIGLGRARKNNIGNGFVGNILGYTFDENNIGNGFKWNRIEEQFYDNGILHYFNKNIIAGYFEDNNIASGFNSNIVSGEFQEMIINSANVGKFFKGHNQASLLISPTNNTFDGSTYDLYLGNLNLKTDLLTSIRNIQMPDESGTLAITSDFSNFELDLTRKATGNSYMEFTETGGNVTNVDYWTDSGKGTKLFSKVITWVGNNPTQGVITDETNGKILTTTIDWSVPTNPKVTKVVT